MRGDPDGKKAIGRFLDRVLTTPATPTHLEEGAALGVLVELGMGKPAAVTKRYVVSNGRGFWLVGYVQADGLVTVHTSEGCWGYPWSYHGHETILHWLAECGLHDLDYYIPSKLSNGEKEYDAKATYRGIHQYLCRETLRIGREFRHVKELGPGESEWSPTGRKTPRQKKREALEWLREERDLLRRVTREWGDELPRECFGEWFNETRIDDAGEMAVYRYPHKLTNMLKSIWPAFIEAVRKDIGWQEKSGPRTTPSGEASPSP